jgi:hypothetical protein
MISATWIMAKVGVRAIKMILSMFIGSVVTALIDLGHLHLRDRSVILRPPLNIRSLRLSNTIMMWWAILISIPQIRGESGAGLPLEKNLMMNKCIAMGTTLSVWRRDIMKWTTGQ